MGCILGKFQEIEECKNSLLGTDFEVNTSDIQKGCIFDGYIDVMLINVDIDIGLWCKPFKISFYGITHMPIINGHSSERWLI